MTGRFANRTTKGEIPHSAYRKGPVKERGLLKIPREGVEPSHPKVTDFESVASANSAIWAKVILQGYAAVSLQCKPSILTYGLELPNYEMVT